MTSLLNFHFCHQTETKNHTLGPSTEDGGRYASTGGSPPDQIHHLFIYLRHGNFHSGEFRGTLCLTLKCIEANLARLVDSPLLSAGRACGIGHKLPVSDSGG